VKCKICGWKTTDVDKMREHIFSHREFWEENRLTDIEVDDCWEAEWLNISS